jgi:hypothetical protein
MGSRVASMPAPGLGRAAIAALASLLAAAACSACGGTSWTSPPRSVEQIANFDDHTCALLADGEVVCWGWNFSGQARPPPGPFRPLTLARDIAAVCDRTAPCRAGVRAPTRSLT